ncbi:MAG: hypothetical protein WCI38_01120 [Chthoniobacterales bacterium]
MRKGGTICFEDQKQFISTALAGWDVDLKLRADDTSEVYFAKRLVGHLELATASFRPITAVQANQRMRPDPHRRPPRHTLHARRLQPKPLCQSLSNHKNHHNMSNKSRQVLPMSCSRPLLINPLYPNHGPSTSFLGLWLCQQIGKIID